MFVAVASREVSMFRLWVFCYNRILLVCFVEALFPSSGPVCFFMVALLIFTPREFLLAWCCRQLLQIIELGLCFSVLRCFMFSMFRHGVRLVLYHCLSYRSCCCKMAHWFAMSVNCQCASLTSTCICIMCGMCLFSHGR